MLIYFFSISDSKSLSQQISNENENDEPPIKRSSLINVQPESSDDVIIGLGDQSLKSLIEHITKKVIDNLTSTVSVQSEQNPEETNREDIPIDDLQPNLVEAELKYSKNLSSDSFDEETLLKTVRRPYHKKAGQLLKKIKDNPQIITFNSSGSLFLDGEAVPEANFFKLFPLLFRKNLNSTEIESPGLKNLYHKLKI